MKREKFFDDQIKLFQYFSPTLYTEDNCKVNKFIVKRKDCEFLCKCIYFFYLIFDDKILNFFSFFFLLYKKSSDFV